NKHSRQETRRCHDHVESERNVLRRVRVVVALGNIVFDAWLRLLKRRGITISPRPPFGHAVVTKLGQGLPLLIGCYHPSRQNTNTGKLTARMLEQVFRKARKLLQVRRPDTGNRTAETG